MLDCDAVKCIAHIFTGTGQCIRVMLTKLSNGLKQEKKGVLAYQYYFYLNNTLAELTVVNYLANICPRK